ncbi:YadA-like family protein [Veillonella sp.]|uniref:YadA-like family protein n=1 Tax=Veillonella sp. TaxID=1926307 RepID=UPI0025EF1A2E|nr:YadA-like family protein [Veillonella sp.]
MLKQKLVLSKHTKKASLRVTATLLALISSYSFVSAEKLDLTNTEVNKPNTIADLNKMITTAIGFDNFANNGATSIGYSNEGWSSSVVVGSNNFGVNSVTVIGINSKAGGGIAIGNGATASRFNTGSTLQKRYSNDYATAVGNSSLAVDGTSFGYNARSNNSGVAIGDSSNALNGGTALGNGTTIGGATYDLHRGGAVALGDRAVADRTFGKYGYIPFDKNFTADLSLRYGDARANDIALAKASGDATVIKAVTDFYNNNNISADTYSEWKRLRQTYMAYYQGYNQQLAKMTTTTYADEAARQADYNTLQAWDAAQKDASSKLNDFEAANNINEDSVAAKNSILATYKSTEGAVSVGRSAVYDKNGNLIRQAQTRQIINVAAGSADTDAVNVAQLKTVVTKVTEFNNVINQNITDLTKRVDKIDESVTNLVNNNNSSGGQGSNQGTTNPGATNPGEDRSADNTGNTGNTDDSDNTGTAGNTGNTDNNDNTGNTDNGSNAGNTGSAGASSGTTATNDVPANLIVENSITVGGNTYITTEGINANGQVISNVGESPLVAGSNAAATVGQVVSVRDQLQESIDSVAAQTMSNSQQISRLGTEINKVAAGSAALAALHPLDFDSNEKVSFAVGMGGYKGEKAAAVGAFYRPNQDIMFNIAASIGSGDDMYNAGVSFKFGESSPYNNMSKTEMANKLEAQDQKLAAQDKNIQSLQADNDELKARLAKLEAALAK